MRLFNLKSWDRLCAAASVCLIAAPISLLLLFIDPVFLWLAAPLAVFPLAIGILGGIQGILFALKKLRVGCPVCGATARVTDGSKRFVWLQCPQCGGLTVSTGLGRMKIIPHKPAPKP